MKLPSAGAWEHSAYAVPALDFPSGVTKERPFDGAVWRLSKGKWAGVRKRGIPLRAERHVDHFASNLAEPV